MASKAWAWSGSISDRAGAFWSHCVDEKERRTVFEELGVLLLRRAAKRRGSIVGVGVVDLQELSLR